MSRILIADDDDSLRSLMGAYLSAEGHDVELVTDGAKAIAAAARATPDAVFLDLHMPGVGGLAALRALRATDPELPIIIVTADGAIDAAVEATRLGAAYLCKPFELPELTLVLERIAEGARLKTEVSYLRQQGMPHGYERLVGQSPAMERVFETLRRLERVDAPTVLITGESGTGKDLVAQAIHARGPRKLKPYMAIDCAAMAETLIESELFGHERGSFTDARTQKKGLFEIAAGGVLFLDEIGELTIGTQAKLLRALENRTFKRVGGVVDLPLSAAIIAATNRNLKEAAKAGQFREDLFFRLNVVPIEMAPLRRRTADISTLIDHLLERIARDLNRVVPRMTHAALQALERYAWPGNVRELRNVLERVLILRSDGEAIDIEELPPEIRATARGTHAAKCPFVLPEGGIDLEEVELGFLQQALVQAADNQTAAARLLGISRYAFRYRMEKFGLGKHTAPAGADVMDGSQPGSHPEVR